MVTSRLRRHGAKSKPHYKVVSRRIALCEWSITEAQGGRGGGGGAGRVHSLTACIQTSCLFRGHVQHPRAAQVSKPVRHWSVHTFYPHGKVWVPGMLVSMVTRYHLHIIRRPPQLCASKYPSIYHKHLNRLVAAGVHVHTATWACVCRVLGMEKGVASPCPLWAALWKMGRRQGMVFVSSERLIAYAGLCARRPGN